MNKQLSSAKRLREVALQENIFAALMDAVRVASLGQITQTLYEVGGEYRRNVLTMLILANKLGILSSKSG